MEHPVIVIMPLKVIPYLTGLGYSPEQKLYILKNLTPKECVQTFKNIPALSVNIFQMQFISWHSEQYVMHMRIFGMRMHLEEVPIIT